MIDLSDYSCDKCTREFSRHCKHCLHTAEKPPTRFKHKKKTGVQTPELRKPTPPPPPPTSGSNARKPNPNYIPPASTPRHNPPPMPPIKPAKLKENATMNKTMYGLNLYIPFEELDAYIHERIDAKYRDHTFMPIKVEVNEFDLSIDIKLLSVSPIETDNCRYKLDLNELPKENGECKD